MMELECRALGSEPEVCSSGEDADMEDIPLQVSDRSATPVSCADEDRPYSPSGGDSSPRPPIPGSASVASSPASAESRPPVTPTATFTHPLFPGFTTDG
ncbi:hypothetical protein J6590_026717 [Homalodisca vitripennis]|nr:hypothetical protein J6590_026717 [Homalodisca vitripennis]